MKKRYTIPAVIITLIVVLAWHIVPSQIVSMVTTYEPYTFEMVLGDSAMRQNYGIPDASHPSDYGFKDVEVIDFYSALDSLVLNGWFVKSTKPVNHTLIICHGRTSNRLKTMKYLRLIKAQGLDSLYNVFIPDLRNSGKSTPAPTYMGYAFAEDIAGAIDWLVKEQQQKKISIYGFSMGAMATEILLDRPDLKPYIEDASIEYVILDSPLANVRANLKLSADRMGLPEFIFDRAMDMFNDDVNNYADKMKFRYLLNQNNIPTLILAGSADTTTPIAILKDELAYVDRQELRLVEFEDAQHVRIYQSDQHQEEYKQYVTILLQPQL